MFGRKSRTIKSLEYKVMAAEGGEKAATQMRNTARDLLAKAEARVEELTQGLKFANQTNTALAAERDQLAKRVEDLEEMLRQKDEFSSGLFKELTELKNSAVLPGTLSERSEL